MAPQTYQKRQKELARLHKKQEKAARRLQRKAEKKKGGPPLETEDERLARLGHESLSADAYDPRTD
jgi:hypothetical protein